MGYRLVAAEARADYKLWFDSRLVSRVRPIYRCRRPRCL